MSAEWERLLTSQDRLGTLYGDAPPKPEDCHLFYVHLDERDKSVTLGFETRRLPARMPGEWAVKEFNTVEFYLVFPDVMGFRATGWGASEARRVRLKAREGGLFEVTLGTTASGIRFEAPAPRLTKVRPYLAARQ
jgi:hypothetical protein